MTEKSRGGGYLRKANINIRIKEGDAPVLDEGDNEIGRWWDSTKMVQPEEGGRNASGRIRGKDLVGSFYAFT